MTDRHDFIEALLTPYRREQFLAATALNAFRQLLVAGGVMLQTRALRFLDPRLGAIWLVYLTTISAGLILEFGISARCIGGRRSFSSYKLVILSHDASAYTF